MTFWQRKVKAGDPLAITATAYNAFVDAAVSARLREESLASWLSAKSSTHVQAINRGDVRCEAGSCVVLSEAVEESLKERRTRLLLGFDPEDDGTADTRECIGITQTSAEPNEVVTVCVAGVTMARVIRDDPVTPVRLGSRLARQSGSTPILEANASGNVQMFGAGVFLALDGAVGELCLVRVGGGGNAGGFTARVVSNSTTLNAAPSRWLYGFEECQWDTAISDFVAKPGGLVGQAYNTLEIDNSLSQGYGIALDPLNNYAIHDTNGTFRFKAVPTQVVVKVWSEPADGGDAYFFSAPNRIDGDCG